MATMVNVIPVETKAQVAPKAGSQRSSTDNGKSALGFAKALDIQTEKATKADTNEANSSTAAPLMLGLMGMALPATINVIATQSDDVLDNGITQIVDAKDQLSEMGIASQKMTQNELTNLMQKMTTVNEPVESNNLGSQQAKLQELLNEVQSVEQVQSTGQVQLTVNSTKSIDLTANQALLSAVASTESSNGVGNNNVSQSKNKSINLNDIGAGKFIKSNTSSAPQTIVTSVVPEVVDTDLNTVNAPQIANAPEEVTTTSDSKLNSLLLDGKEQLSAEDSLSTKAADKTETFVNVLNQQTVKNETVVVAPEVKQVVQQPVKDPYNISSQIVEQARLVTGSKNSEMIIQLKPEHLGELTFKVTVESGVVSASFHSNNSEVRNMIEASLPQLKQDLSNQGLKIENVGVYAGLGDFFSNEQRESQQYPEVKVHNKKIEEDFIDALESTSVSESTSEVSGVDYRI
ncbi:flagellar hook-length control protein FliK [Pelosinus sp. UFO1]|uniref:flagellar hook-length control protein FliK n=1 Tax=Pelosinus sp. UFO1 TaxID=484770 RepID=UPI0004D1FBC4|nr:flagellar hook-length control protein FliK [Pelosinus sp. UFO1]AIF52122.1 Flagellar hook-length control protein-like protein [Pelosinus sp. UFO1]